MEVTEVCRRAVGSSSSVSSGYTVVEADPCEPHERCVLCSLTTHIHCWHTHTAGTVPSERKRETRTLWVNREGLKDGS